MNIEQEVREMLNAKVRNAPGMEEPSQPVLRRARVRRARNGAAFAAIVAIIAVGSIAGVRSLVGTQPLEPTGPGTVRNPIPWSAIDGGDLASMRPCNASDLTFRALSDVGALELAPKPRGGRCAIDKGLDLRVFDPSGGRIPIRLDRNAFDDALIIAGRIRAAIIPISYSSPCVPFNGAMRFELVLPHGGGTLQGPASAAGTACPPGTATIVIGQGSIDFGGYNYHNDLIPSIERLPSVVDADGDIRYLVRLQNASDKAVSLDPCPLYEQEIQEEGGFKYLTSLRLNCADAPRSIESGNGLVFEMVFRFQGTGRTPRGATLSWKIEGTGLNAAKNFTLR